MCAGGAATGGEGVLGFAKDSDIIKEWPLLNCSDEKSLLCCIIKYLQALVMGYQHA